MVGAQVAKDFGKGLGLYRGQVDRIYNDDGCVLYHIAYEDGDEEDLDYEECVEAVELRKKIENGEIDEWELGDE